VLAAAWCGETLCAIGLLENQNPNVMVELKVPFALDSTQVLFNPQLAEKGREYFCPACGDTVILKKGEIKVPHFAHKVSDSCSQETIIHITAKQLVQRAITDWKLGKASSPLVKRQCKVCQTIIEQPLPDKVETASIEHRLSDNFVADVALMVGKQAAAAIEIRVTHAVDEVKSASLSIPFIELDGNEVLSSPSLWKPIVDNFRPFPCQTCEDNLKKFNTKITTIAATKGISLPTSYYRYSFCQCWKCKKPTIVFTWPGQDDGQVPTKEPRPTVVQYKFSNTVQSKYWANACIHCNSLQGDFYLYSEPDGPFFAFDCGADTPEDFQEDQKKLAYYANYIGQI
jgi:hypothetical protein